MYASGAGKGRSSGGTPSGRNRQSYGLGRGQVFLEVVRCGSFRSAAERPELSIKVVRRRIDDFERQVGATLFTRDVHGTRLTDEGSLISCFGSRTHGGRLVRPAARRQFRHQHAFGRSPGRHHRRFGNVLAGPSPCRLPGVFPTYACALGGKIIPLEIELRWPYDIWLSYHPGSGRIPRVRHMIDWLVEAFNPAKFP